MNWVRAVTWVYDFGNRDGLGIFPIATEVIWNHGVFYLASKPASRGPDSLVRGRLWPSTPARHIGIDGGLDRPVWGLATGA